uniref:NADH-ubiquinone oxidoreductase chain 1 n=1 Tax=Limnadia lenticularis TaxID=84336 RepID=A0A3G1RRY0_9CRUS|nr:NADH dehydrogenase subunit 1 [Limnadia lenticularis]AXH81660.1 NADH dehydrogenase subunit 1 [Limnadia lenticularis]
MHNLISMIIIVVMVLVSVAFLTLFERKLLGYIQIRKGPNKLGFMGMLQPFSDAIKLFTKEQNSPRGSNSSTFLISPLLSLFFSPFHLIDFPLLIQPVKHSNSILILLCVMSLNVYAILISGWSSNSKYPLLGALRGVAQTISYEVSLALIIVSFLVMFHSLDLTSFNYFQQNCWMLLVAPTLAMIWFTSSLAETNRTPFDFAEGESELVSGFNTEYSSGGFAMIMLAEYTSIIFMSMLFSHMFLGGMMGSLSTFAFAGCVYLFVWTRGTLPRFRYDKLMNLAWKSFLPVSLNLMILFSSISILF